MIVTDRGVPRRIDVPVEVPEGVDRDSVVNERSAQPTAGLSNLNAMASQMVTVVSDSRVDTTTVGGTTKIDRSMIDPGSVARTKTSKPKKERERTKGSGGVGPGKGGGIGPGRGGNIGGGGPAGGGGGGSNFVVDGLDKKDAERVHPEIAALIQRLKQPNYLANADEAKFVHDGKAELKIWLNPKSETVMARLKELGFELVLDPKASSMVVGRVPLSALQKLITLKEVRFVAPQY